MREIKFRAFNKNKKIMVYTNEDCSAAYWDGAYTSNIEIINLTLNSASYEQSEYYFMQFTGLKDRNGMDIYEDDIICGECSSNPIYVCEGLQQSNLMGKKLTGIVKYSDIFAKFYFTTDDITFLDFQNGISDFEVIGNIHQNPNLLEKE